MLNITVLSAPLRPPTLPPFVVEKASPPPSPPPSSPRDVMGDAAFQALRCDELLLESSSDVLHAVTGLSAYEVARRRKSREVGRRHVISKASRVTPAHAYQSVDLLPPRALTRKARKLRMTEFGWEVTRANCSGVRTATGTLERRGSFDAINMWLRTHVDARTLAWDGIPMVYGTLRLP